MKLSNYFNHWILKNKSRKKSQSAMEFILMIGFVIFFFTIALLAVDSLILEQSANKEDLAVKSIATNIVNEISMAHSASEGYERNFNIPEEANLQVSLIDGFVQVKKGSRSTAYPVYPVIGNLQNRTNTIKKINNTVYLN